MYTKSTFVRHFLDTDQWTFSASVFGHAGDPEIIKRMHYPGRLTTREKAEQKAIGLCENGLNDGMLDQSSPSMDRTKAVREFEKI